MIKICKIHGELVDKDIIKSGKSKKMFRDINVNYV